MWRTWLGWIVAVGVAFAQPHEFGPGASNRFSLLVHKTGLMAGKSHVFVFERFRGTADDSKVAFVIEAASLKCEDDWSPAKGSIEKIEKVAKEELLEAGRFPELRFASTAVSKTAQGYEVDGTLTIRSVSRPVRVRVIRTGDGFEATAQIRHSDFGLKRQSAALGAIGTKDEMDVSVRLTAAK